MPETPLSQAITITITFTTATNTTFAIMITITVIIIALNITFKWEFFFLEKSGVKLAKQVKTSQNSPNNKSWLVHIVPYEAGLDFLGKKVI